MNQPHRRAVVPAMRRLSLSTCLLAWSLGGAALAQDATSAAVEPGPVAIEAARRALRAEREQERLQLTDAWMKHEEREERESLGVSRWFAVAFHGVLAGTFGVVAVANELDDGPLGGTLAASAGAAVSLGLMTTQILIEDDRDAARFGVWAFVAEFALAGAGLIVASAMINDLSSDGQLLYGVFAAQSFIQAATIAVISLAYPRLFLSEHYRDYLARPDDTRAQRGLDLLLERERRQRMAVYGGFGIGVTQAGTYGVAAVLLDEPDVRAGFAILAGVTLVNAAANLIIQLVTRTPAESIIGGFPAPAPEAEAF